MVSKEEEKIRKVILDLEAQGYSKDDLKKTMIKKGYPKSVINDVFGVAKKVPTVRTKKPAFKPPTPMGQVQKPQNKILYFGIGGIVLVIIVVSAIIFFAPFRTNCNFNTACFIEKANNCESALFVEDIEGSIVEFTISPQCVLTKKITQFSPAEPPEIVALFGNKEMTCSYTKGGFDVDYTTFLGNVDLCRGDLKEAIYELRIAQFEILGE